MLLSTAILVSGYLTYCLATFKVEAQIMDEQVRVTGKKIDELQAVISNVRAASFEIPVQFVNMK